MKSKLILAVVSAMLALVSQASATSFEIFSYSGNNYTTNPDPAAFGSHMFSIVNIIFDSSVTTAADATGTYTLSGGPNGIMSFFTLTSNGYSVSALPNDPAFSDFFNPLSYVTLDHGMITNWALAGTANYLGPTDTSPPVFIESISQTPNPFGQPVEDFVAVQCNPGDNFPNLNNAPCNGLVAAVLNDPSTWQVAFANFVPAPSVGTGLPGLILACGGLLGWWRRRQKIT